MNGLVSTVDRLGTALDKAEQVINQLKAELEKKECDCGCGKCCKDKDAS